MIGALIPELMRAIGSIGKTMENKNQNYKFRGIDDVLNHVGTAAAELGVRVEVECLDHKEEIQRYEEYQKQKFRVFASLRMVLRFYAPDGSCHTCSAIGSSVDTQGDKATSKAMSAAFKYACFLGLVIPVDGALDDSDSAKPAPEINTETVDAPPVDTDAWHKWVVPFKGSRVEGMSLGQMVVESSREDIWGLNEWIGKQAAKAEADNNEAKYEYYREVAQYTARALKELDNQPASPTVSAATVPGV